MRVTETRLLRSERVRMDDAELEWAKPPLTLTLPSHEVHIWRAHFDLTAQSVTSFRRVLSAEEVDRAARFHFEKDQRRYIIARGILRYVLGRYLEIPPAEVQIRYNTRGKPEVATSSSLNFNLSHSGNIILYAFGQNRKIGIDIEQIRNNVEFLELAQHSFSPLERAALAQMPPQSIPQAFFNCWTRKEAYIKAIGEGFYFPLDCFDVSLIPGEPATLIQIGGSPQEAARWAMRELWLDPAYAAALVVEGNDWQPRFWQWS